MKAPIVGSMVLVTIYLLFKVCLHANRLAPRIENAYIRNTRAIACGGSPGLT